MVGHDAEIELIRHGVSCAVLLERLPPVWRLDKRQSTRRALKYRRAEGEVLIINHDGRGWWDPCSSAKGDVFALVQHLDQGLNFGQVRQVLRAFMGIRPSFPTSEVGRGRTVDRSVAHRLGKATRAQPGVSRLALPDLRPKVAADDPAGCD